MVFLGNLCCFIFGFFCLMILFLFYRRVHISDATLKCLNETYEVEPGDGCSRDNHLKMMNITTYLIKRTDPLRFDN